MSGRMLSLLDARSFGCVLFVAQFQRNREALLMSGAAFTSQAILVLDLEI
jgi:hypothetical protein